ncbi:MAG: T9SS type A sorting domain-containing protein [Bacteroidota bacterium]|jgi:Secretion system C-terminal sorting domain
MKKLLFIIGFLFFSFLKIWAQNPTMVLIEVFTGASCRYCPESNAHVDSLVAANPHKVMAIKYQSAPPGYDPMYEDDSADVNQLASYYHPTGFPEGYISGQKIYPTHITQARIDSINSIGSPFTLTLNQSFNKTWDTMYVRLLIRANVKISFSAGVLHARIAISEDSIWFFAPPGSNIEKTFYRVLEKMIPGANGIVLKDHWDKDQLDSVLVSCPVPGTTYNLNNLSVNAWIQTDDNKGLLQSALSPPVKLPHYALTDRLASLQLAPVQCFDTLKEAKLVFSNTGTQLMTSCRLGWTIDNGSPVTTTWTGSLSPGASAQYIIPPSFLGNGMHTIRVQADLPQGQPIMLSRMATYSNSISVQKTSIAPPLLEYCNHSGFPYPGWAVYNQDKNGNTFHWIRYKMDTTKYMLGAIQLRWFIMTPGTVNEIYLPAVDVSTKSSLSLSFDMDYANFGALSHDTLKVLVSPDCGQTWNTVFSGQGSEISTTTLDQFEYDGYLPDTTKWATHNIDLTSYMGSPRLLIKLRAISNYGNDMYLRKFRVGPHTGTPDLPKESFSVFPNPANNRLTVEFHPDAAMDMIIKILNADGRVVKESRFAALPATCSMELDVSSLVTGLYILEINSSNRAWRKKFLVSEK